MTKRVGGTQHYENLIEKILRENEILHIAIDESKRPLYGGKRIKNFDFIVSSFKGKYLIDIKGKQFPYGKSGFWENWIDLPPFIVAHAKLERHDHKPLEPEVCIPKNFAAGIYCILYANTL